MDGRQERELEKHPESGFPGHIMGPRVILQSWRSFDHLEAHARDPDRLHWPAWTEFDRRGRRAGVGPGSHRVAVGPPGGVGSVPTAGPFLGTSSARMGSQ